MPDAEHHAWANDLANALTLALPGHLRKSLEMCSPEELELVQRILDRATLEREMLFDSRETQRWVRAAQAERDGLP